MIGPHWREATLQALLCLQTQNSVSTAPYESSNHHPTKSLQGPETIVIQCLATKHSRYEPFPCTELICHFSHYMCRGPATWGLICRVVMVVQLANICSWDLGPALLFDVIHTNCTARVCIAECCMINRFPPELLRFCVFQIPSARQIHIHWRGIKGVALDKNMRTKTLDPSNSGLP